MSDLRTEPDLTEAKRRIEAARVGGATVLDLSGLRLRQLPDAVAGLTSLQDLNLNSNHLTALPDTLARLTNLRSLYLWRNQLTTLPDAITHLSRLQLLHLGSNQLTRLPETIARLTDLRQLRLGGNQLTTFPEAIIRLSMLEDLDLGHNRITTLPDTIAQLTKLQSLNLRDNPSTLRAEQLLRLLAERRRSGDDLTGIGTSRPAQRPTQSPAPPPPKPLAPVPTSSPVKPSGLPPKLGTGLDFLLGLVTAVGAAAAEWEAKHPSKPTSKLAFKHESKPEPIEETIRDPVECAVSHPTSVTGATPFIVRALVYKQSDYDAARQRIERESTDPQRFWYEPGSTVIPRGAGVSFQLKVGGWPIEPAVKTVLWTGEIATVSFRVTPNPLPNGNIVAGTCVVFAGGLQVADVKFEIKVTSQADEATKTVMATLPRSGFVSYAHKDLLRVDDKVQVLHSLGTDIYMDRHSLRAGDRWEEKIPQYIDACDAFYLFWSRNAARSAWVKKEWQHALEHKGLAIIHPMPLDDPRRVPPPEALAALHFDDCFGREKINTRNVGLMRRLRTWMHLG